MEIVLIRHGKPASADSPRLTASQYTQWIRRYNFSDVATDSQPNTQGLSINKHFLITSDYIRAIHSADIYLGRQPEQVSSLFREMEIPRYKLPFRLKAMTWVYLCRVLWMLGAKGPFETFAAAKARAKIAADNLVEIAHEKGKVVLFGHGYMNLFIRKALIQQGWKLHHKSNAYWGITSLSY